MNRKVGVALASLCIGALAGLPFAQAGGVGQIYGVVQSLFGGKQIRVSAPTNGQALVYQSSTNSWVNGSAAGSTPTLAQVLAAGANGDQVTVTNLGNLSISGHSPDSFVTNYPSILTQSGHIPTAGTVFGVRFADTLYDNGNNSTTVARALAVTPIVNYTGGTRTGVYEVLVVDPTVTSAPTGANLLAAFRLGGANVFTFTPAGLETITASGTGNGAAINATAASITQGFVGSVAKFTGGTNQVVAVGMGTTGAGGAIGYGRSTDGAIAVVEGAAVSLGSGESDFVSYGSGLRLCSDGNGSSSGEIGFYMAPSTAVAFANNRVTTTKKWVIKDVATYPLQGQTGMVFGWTGSTDASAALTTTLSQSAAGVLAVGTSAANALGTVQLTTLEFASTRSKLTSSANGIVAITDNAGTGFTRLALGPVTSNAHPGFRNSGATLEIVAADNSAFAPVSMANLGLVSSTSQIVTYRGISTAGFGVPAIFGSGRSTAQTAAVASVAAYTVGGADGSFEVWPNVNVTASTTNSITVTCTYTDENNTSRTITFSFVQNGVPAPIQTITNVTGVGAYAGMPLRVRCKAATTITVATTGTFTSVTYNVEASIMQIS